MAMMPLVSEGKIIKLSFIMEDLTGLDETYPQHYDMPTSAIDWTIDPLIALFFAVYTDKSISNTKYLSVSIFKEINKETSPIMISDKDSLKNNERATAQKGAFVYFRRPCSYFLETGFFPSIESYDTINKKYNLFEFEKFPLLRTKENLKYIKLLLDEHQINEEKLKLSPGEPWPF